MRPEIMKEFERAGELSLLNLADHKETGGKVAGVYCLFAPTELVRAAGAIPVSLCGKKEAPIAAAEKTLPPHQVQLRVCSDGYVPRFSPPRTSSWAKPPVTGKKRCSS